MADLRDAEIHALRKEGFTYAEIAPRYGITVERIRQILRRMDGLPRRSLVPLGAVQAATPQYRNSSRWVIRRTDNRHIAATVDELNGGFSCDRCPNNHLYARAAKDCKHITHVKQFLTGT